MNARPHGREVFFVGSIALPNAATVFETIGRAFGSAVRRIPDGETGNRLGWMEWQTPLLAANPLLEAIPSEGDWRNPTARIDGSSGPGSGCVRTQTLALFSWATSGMRAMQLRHIANLRSSNRKA